MIYEACVETLEEAVSAEQYGAHRIELCSRLDLDGLTPSPELIREVCNTLKIPVMVMIRPRGGDFVYTDQEISQMTEEIQRAKTFRISGIVFGMLKSDNQIDSEHCLLLSTAACPLPVTFHKAIDCLRNPVEGVRQLRQVPGITRILTSGGKATAREGAEKIRELIREAGDQITILVAGKVTKENVAEIQSLTGASEFHGRRIVISSTLQTGIQNRPGEF